MARASIEALRRGEIADAAITVIAREGYEATTMRALAAELGVSTGTITHWYATKDDVLAAALGAAADRVAVRIDTAVRDLDDPRAVLEAIGEASIPDTPAAIEEQLYGRLFPDAQVRSAARRLVASALRPGGEGARPVVMSGTPSPSRSRPLPFTSLRL
jgi:AcrR family transcriptional regulator